MPKKGILTQRKGTWIKDPLTLLNKGVSKFNDIIPPHDNDQWGSRSWKIEWEP